MPSTRLELQTRDGARPGEKVIVLEGVLNTDTTSRFRDAMRGHEAPTLIIDMSEVRSMDSSGLGVLIGAYVSSERNCRRLLLVGVNDRIWDLFRTCRIEDVFTRYPTVAAAEQAVSE
jgi:anti-sigma B factor antagonist